MSSIAEIEEEIISEFDMFGDDWEAKYEYLIDLGKTLPVIDPALKTDDRIIKGCQSRVWLDSKFENGSMSFTADSDAIITKGMVALMIRALNHQRPADVVKAPLAFVDKIGLKEHLSPTRANGLLSMIQRMKTDSARFV